MYIPVEKKYGNGRTSRKSYIATVSRSSRERLLSLSRLITVNGTTERPEQMIEQLSALSLNRS